MADIEKLKQDQNGAEEMQLDDTRRVKVLSPGMLVFKRFIRNRLAVVGFTILFFMFTFSFIGPFFSPYGQTDVFKGIVDYTDLFGGRFLREDFYGRTARGPFQGLAIWGHDNAKKLYTSVWIDSLGTATMVSYGTFDPIDQKLEFKGDMTDPVTGQQSQIRSVDRIISESEHLFEMYETRGPSQVKTLEVNYKRG